MKSYEYIFEVIGYIIGGLLFVYGAFALTKKLFKKRVISYALSGITVEVVYIIMLFKKDVTKACVFICMVIAGLLTLAFVFGELKALSSGKHCGDFEKDRSANKFAPYTIKQALKRWPYPFLKDKGVLNNIKIVPKYNFVNTESAEYKQEAAARKATFHLLHWFLILFWNMTVTGIWMWYFMGYGVYWMFKALFTTLKDLYSSNQNNNTNTFSYQDENSSDNSALSADNSSNGNSNETKKSTLLSSQGDEIEKTTNEHNQPNNTSSIISLEKAEKSQPYNQDTKLNVSNNTTNTINNSETQQKSKMIYVLFGIIGILLLGIGILGGVLFMKNKQDKNTNSSLVVATETTTQISSTNNISETTVTTTNTPTTSQEPKTTTVVQKSLKEFPASDISNYPLYINALKNNISSNMYKAIYNVSDVGYALYDINADNAPELVVLAGNPDIYSIHNGEAVGLTPFWGGNMVKGIFLYESGYIGMTSVSPDGEAYTSYFKYSGGPDTKRVEPSPEEIGKDIEIPFTPITSISEINNYISASNSSKPTINAQLIVERGLYEGVEVYLSVSGDYSYYNYDSYEYGPNSSSTPSPRSGSSSENKIYITGFSGGVSRVEVDVTPYNSNNVAGDTVKATYTRVSSNVNSITSCTKYGNIYSPSGSNVDGLTDSYLIYGGSATYERHDLTDGWHIVAVNAYYDGSVYWYELYDADDGDYYGWVNENNITFY